ncbi:ATP-binding cassette domain-containing protein [Corynebacterium sp. HMSC066C02]|uniref:ATP-binding cassette domain-containing protein n=1 Tax=Corynebacterium sp. HMSC066C02 TaxID=1739500 RepID=UPI00352F7061
MEAKELKSGEAIGAASESGSTAADSAAGSSSAAQAPVISVRNLTKEFDIRGQRGGKKLLKAVDDVSFDIRRGTTLALVGESGSGKSTVANMVLGLLEPTSGTIEFEGRDTSTLSKQELFKLRRKMQVVFQNPYGSLDPMYSIYKCIEEPMALHKVGSRKEREARVAELLDMVSMPRSAMRRYPNELSGGQRQRIAIARALALRPEVIVLDEAVSALDVLVQNQIIQLLAELQSELSLSYLFITHDLAVVRQTADDVVVMKKGQAVEQGTADDIFENAQQEYTRNLINSVPGMHLEIGTGH